MDFPRPIFIKELPKRIRGGKVGLYKCMAPNCSREFEMLMYRFNDKKNPVKSCGCYKRNRIGIESKTHGMANTREFRIWCGLRMRCKKENASSGKNYAGRDIQVCKQWLDKDNGFKNFYKDMGDRPSKEYSIERIDNYGDYCPENCKWGTKKEQARNRRTSKYIEYKGYNATVAEWGEITGISPLVINQRLKNGWSIEKSLTKSTKRNIEEKITIILPNKEE